MCAQCHLAAGAGHAVGPDFGSLAHRGVEDLVSNILDPDHAIHPDYVAFEVVSVSGAREIGLIEHESSSALTLLQAGGERRVIPRQQVASMASTGHSLMPAGLEQGLDPQALRDLIALIQATPPGRRRAMNGTGALARARRWVERALVLALALLAVAWYMKQRPIAPEAIDAALLRPPVQSATARPQFSFEFRGSSVRVKPVAEYALDGLVMSQNDVESFADIYHDSSSVDTKDLCVLWGTSLESDDFHQVRVTNGPFTCYFRYPQGIRFRPQDLANNHLITDDDALRGQHRRGPRRRPGPGARPAGRLPDGRLGDRLARDLDRAQRRRLRSDLRRGLRGAAAGSAAVAPTLSSELVADRDAPCSLGHPAVAELSRASARRRFARRRSNASASAGCAQSKPIRPQSGSSGSRPSALISPGWHT